jgi:nanoRNase/pAp phosphatase (c-di-AMP/oligoRNAs hydrolase)
MLQSIQKAVIVTHVNADPDALSSACALSKVIQSLNTFANTKILLPEGMNQESKRIYELCKELGIQIVIVKKYSDIEEKEPNDICVIVDTASFEQLRLVKDYVKQNCKSILILDHHQFRDFKELDTALKIVCISSEIDYSSTSEIAFMLLDRVSNRIDSEILRKLATILLAGVLSDTKRFQRIAKNTFYIVANMIKYGADYENALHMLTVEKSPTSRIARIKCVLRHRGFKIRIKGREIYVAISNVGAFESDCATFLIALGYDVVFVLTEDDKLKAIRLIYRGKEDIITQLNIDIFTEFVRKLIDVYGGGGGGHKAAGGAILRIYDLRNVVTQLIKVMNSVSEVSVMEIVEEKPS